MSFRNLRLKMPYIACRIERTQSLERRTHTHVRLASQAPGKKTHTRTHTFKRKKTFLLKHISYTHFPISIKKMNSDLVWKTRLNCLTRRWLSDAKKTKIREKEIQNIQNEKTKVWNKRLRCGQWSTLDWRYKTHLPSLLLWLSSLSSPFLEGGWVGGQHICMRKNGR
jgi:hypothetical protein